MSSSEAQKRAVEKYAQTEKGKEARLRAVQKHQATEHGQDVLKAAQKRFEQTEARKAYRREWARQKRLKLKMEQQNSENKD
ncbi:MAG TPA: hypothetical protein V6D19_06200 [Stenomitos sp.]